MFSEHDTWSVQIHKSVTDPGNRDNDDEYDGDDGDDGDDDNDDNNDDDDDGGDGATPGAGFPWPLLCITSTISMTMTQGLAHWMSVMAEHMNHESSLHPAYMWHNGIDQKMSLTEQQQLLQKGGKYFDNLSGGWWGWGYHKCNVV